MGNQSNHYKNKRYKREKFISKCLCGDGKVIDSFIVDRNHPNGEEIHELTDTGLIIIRNLESQKIVTKLIARRNQITRYYHDVDKKPPPSLLRLAEWHESMRYNK